MARLTRNLAAGLALLAGLALVFWLAWRGGTLDLLVDRDAFHQWITGLGWRGPIAVIATMTLAIVFSPLPSAPIALAAGAAYGHGWGTLYVLIGAELGAIVAFTLARLLGRDIVQRWLGERLDVGLLGSQNTLTVIVFASRLLPFVSFDLISYAAGLTALAFWRFAVATLAGILPASFLLAHFGGEMASGEASRIATTVIALGALTLIPVAWGVWLKRKKKG